MPTPSHQRSARETIKRVSCRRARGGQEPYKRQLEPMLVQYVLPTFASPAGHLRAKAAWVAGQFADIRFREQPGAGALLPPGAGATFQSLFQRVLGLLRDPDLPVRRSTLMLRMQHESLAQKAKNPSSAGPPHALEEHDSSLSQLACWLRSLPCSVALSGALHVCNGGAGRKGGIECLPT